jgi:hypothetical protein
VIQNVIWNVPLIYYLYYFLYLCWCPGLSWSWSSGSWIYDYLWNQCLSPPRLYVRIPLKRCVLDTTSCDKLYVIKFVSDLRQVGAFLRFPPPIQLTATILLKYCWKKVALNTINQQSQNLFCYCKNCYI